ncbi:MAG TPA: tetraacyldisaccharide 4'-kinase [Fibrobacteres bacterium]|jgi:tetraacyldisaccharide 4'-kinase|nr:tetraacyldisaccharide 4'-kinase [Fibrobacterota bacterium]
MFFSTHRPSWFSRIIAPLSPLYALLRFLHGTFWLRTGIHDPKHLLPLVVIGSLRAGGAGKTAVVLELARRLKSQRLRVAILAYRIQKNANPALLFEVTSNMDWKQCSDEAVLLARESGMRVFVTRNREHAWDALSRSNEFDVLISDDGLMDPRLRNAFRIVLKRPEENPGIFDLLPAGPYRLTSSFLKEADCVVLGPSNETGSDSAWFRRELIFPKGFDFEKKYWAVCGMGNPTDFVRDLRYARVHLAGISHGPNHALPELDRVWRQAERCGVKRFVCSAKDWIKLESSPISGSVDVIGEHMELGPGLLNAVKKYLASHASS